jgi:spoIIIJ-associated protein
VGDVSGVEGVGTVVSRGDAVASAAGQEDQELDSVINGSDLLGGEDDLDDVDETDDDLADEADDLEADDEDDEDEAEDAADALADEADDEDDEDEDEDDEEDAEEEDEEDDLTSLEEEGDVAADYIEGLLDIADLDGDIDMDVEGDRAVVSVVGATLDELVGDDGEVLEALQELTRLAVHRKTGTRARLMLDVGGFRVRRRAELADLGRSVADEVARTGEPKKLRAMSPFERKIIHDAVAVAGLRSESEGEEPNRRVVVFPAG